MPHISFFVYRQPWATTITPSVPSHLIFPGKTTFLNGIYNAFKVWFLKIQPRHAKKHNSNHFFNSTQDYYFVCWILKLLYNEIFGKFGWVLHLEIYKSLTLIQLLTHYTKSFLKSLINQLTHHTITSSLTHSPHITHSVFSSLPHLICTHSSQIYSLRHTLTHSLPHPLTLTHTPYHSQPHSLTLQFNWIFIPHEIDIPSLFLYKKKFDRFK